MFNSNNTIGNKWTILYGNADIYKNVNFYGNSCTIYAVVFLLSKWSGTD